VATFRCVSICAPGCGRPEKPARFAFHKLVIAERRVPAFQTKSRKHIDQAEQLFAVLLRDRPGDLRLAWNAALTQPARLLQQLRRGFRKLSVATQEALAAATRMAAR
jgi:hypothetical protein